MNKQNALISSIIAGVGHYLPKKVLKNHDLPSHLDTSHEWIVERTGIHQRHIAGAEESTAFMAYRAGLQALENSGIEIDAIDAIIVATTTPDHGFPAVATRVQALLGMTRGFGFDVQAVCSGFVYALSVADNFIKTGQAKTVLLIGAESMSRILDWNDRGTCILFGDGAGAFVLTANTARADDNPTEVKQGVLSTHLYSDGKGYDLLYVDREIETPQQRGAVVMNGREIFKNAVHKIGEAVEKALAHNELKVSDIDCFVPHQANARIIKGIIDRFSLPQEKVVMTVAEHANTSAASIPLAVYAAIQEGKIQKGHLVLLEAMGGGLTWGSALIRW